MEQPHQIILEHSLKKGFDPTLAGIVATDLTNLALEYQNKERAKKVFGESYQRQITGPFLREQLKTFIRVVRRESFYPDEFEVELELDEDETLEELKERNPLISPSLRFYPCTEEQYAAATRNARELVTLREMEVGHFYGMLKQRVFRPIVVNPNFKQARGGLIYTPSGGMPDYHKRRKVR